MNLGSQQCWTKLCLTWSPATPEMFRDEAENVTGSPPAWVWLPLEAVSPVFTPGTRRSATVAGVTSVTRTQPAGGSVLSDLRETSTSLRGHATLTREYTPHPPSITVMLLQDTAEVSVLGEVGTRSVWRPRVFSEAGGRVQSGAAGTNLWGDRILLQPVGSYDNPLHHSHWSSNFIEIPVVRAGRIGPVCRTQYAISSLVVVSVTRPALVRAGSPLATCVTSKYQG